MSPLKNKKLLIVEDEPMLRESIADLFLMMGVEVAVSANGLEAFAMLTERWFDIVISDINMPLSNGVELMKKIKSIPGERPICFLLTGHFETNAVEMHALGVSQIFHKPFKAMEFISEIERYVSMSHGSPV